MPKFTKGPWYIDKNLDIKKGATFIAPISIVPRGTHKVFTAETKANARLIAAAPEMYELLQAFLKQAEPQLMELQDAARKLLAQIDKEE